MPPTSFTNCWRIWLLAHARFQQAADPIAHLTTRYARTREEADRPMITAYPPPAQVAGVLFNAIFLDQLDGDALQLRQINDLIEKLPDDKRQGLRPIELLVVQAVRRSRAIGECLRGGACRKDSGSSLAASARARRARTTCSAW